MKSIIRSFITITLAMMINSNANAANFSFTFDWCIGTPEFQLKNVPKGTKTLKLNMIDHDYRNGYDHGGATIEYNGQKKIECGEFNSQSWQEPQPPFGHIHRYEFTIDAIDGSGNVLASSKFMRQYGEGKLISD